MRIAKISLLLLLITLALVVMTGCRLAPFKEEWHFFSYKEDMTFINGVKFNMGFSDASHAYPFAGIENQNIGISFTKDGNVEFTPKDGKTLYGTYTYENQGLSYTSFTITLDNGDTIEGSSMKTAKEKKLALTYEGTIYNFTTESQRSGITMDDIIERILDGELDSLHEAEVIISGEECGVQFSEMLHYPIKEGTAVFAVRINSDGTYEILDKVYEGKVLSTYNNKADYVVLYYID